MAVTAYGSALLCVALLGGAQPSPTTELVGLTRLGLQPGEAVWVFTLELHEGRIVAICNVPEGWTIKAENFGEAGNYKDGGGRIEASADFGHDALSEADLVQLEGFILIDRSSVHGQRATLTGDVTLSGPEGNRTMQLQPPQFLRKSAGACPALRPRATPKPSVTGAPALTP